MVAFGFSWGTPCKTQKGLENHVKSHPKCLHDLGLASAASIGLSPPPASSQPINNHSFRLRPMPTLPPTVQLRSCGIPGHPDDINPYRSKLGGILAIVIITEAIATFHDIANGTIEIGCDCQSGLIAVFEHVYDTPKQPHHDIIHEIHRKLADSRLTWKF
jgi:hypothetical protein